MNQTVRKEHNLPDRLCICGVKAETAKTTA